MNFQDTMEAKVDSALAMSFPYWYGGFALQLGIYKLLAFFTTSSLWVEHGSMKLDILVLNMHGSNQLGKDNMLFFKINLKKIANFLNWIYFTRKSFSTKN